MAGSEVKHQISPRVRGAFWEGLLKYSRDNDMTLPEVFCDWIEKDGLAIVLPIISKFNPKELNVDANLTHSGLVGVLSGLAPVIEHHITSTLEQDDIDTDQLITKSIDSKPKVVSSS